MLINRARTRVIEGYVEKHHVLPRCMGGSDDPSNLVALTAEEHYVAHLLLVKIHPTNAKLIYAANMMLNRNNKSYGWVKRKFSEAIKIQNKGQIVTDQQRAKMSKAGKGKTKSEECKSKIGIAHTKTLEYNGENYFGFDDLKSKTGISYHLYYKYYLNGIDPSQYVNNKLHGIKSIPNSQRPKAALGKKWFNNGIIERYLRPDEVASDWIKGRIYKRKHK